MKPKPVTQRTAVSTPLPCYGIELDLGDPTCQKCPHLRDCHKDSGERRDRIPLQKVEFQLIPPSFGQLVPLPGEDPEFVHINSVYSLCYQTVFGKHVHANLKREAPQIAAAAARQNCSIRLYMLASMLGFQQAGIARAKEEAAIEKDVTAVTTQRPFTASMLLNKRAESSVSNFAHICRSRFGTFTLNAIDLLTERDQSNPGVEARMLQSEIIAAQHIVAIKSGEGGPAEPSLYAMHEFNLDEHWLAVEPSYAQLVLYPKKAPNPPFPTSQALERKRFAVKQTIAFMKRNPTAGLAAHVARNNIMQAALLRVLTGLRLPADTLEVDPDPVVDAFEFWKRLGWAVQHLHCLRIYYGKHIQIV